VFLSTPKAISNLSWRRSIDRNCNGNGERGLGQWQLQWHWGTGAGATVTVIAMAMGQRSIVFLSKHIVYVLF
jgi:hypothetical protein